MKKGDILCVAKMNMANMNLDEIQMLAMAAASAAAAAQQQQQAHKVNDQVP